MSKFSAHLWTDFRSWVHRWTSALRKHVFAALLDPTADRTRSDLLRANLVHQLSRNISTILFASSAIALLVAWVMRDHVPAPQLFTWLFCIIALNCARYVYAQVASRPHQDLSPSRQSSAALTSFAAISGLVWGAAAVLFFPTDAVLHQVFLKFVIGGLVAGSAVSYASWPPAFYAFAVPSILPLAVQFIWRLCLESGGNWFWRLSERAEFCGGQAARSRVSSAIS